MPRELKNIPSNLQQRILRLVGLMDSTLLGNDTYYQLRIIDILVNWLGEEYISKELKSEGHDWVKIKKSLEDMNKKVQKVKALYDIIEDKKFSKLDKELKKKAAFFKYASKVPLFGNPATFMYVWFVMKTNLQQLQVRSEYYKIIEQSGYKTMDVKKTKTTDLPTI